MLYRCNNPRCEAYQNYGGRGIRVCDEWSDDISGYDNFKNWAIQNGYNESLTIDRIDNNKGYSPSNCHWVDECFQASNKRNNIVITINGESHIAAYWAEIYDIPKKTLYARLGRGWSAERALFTPIHKKVQ